jgi:hypothetical protein
MAGRPTFTEFETILFQQVMVMYEKDQTINWLEHTMTKPAKFTVLIIDEKAKKQELTTY